MTTENLGRVVGFSILSGAGVPSGGLGDNGDSYLNSSNGDVYSKTGGTWSITGNIQGVQGVQGFSILSGAGAPTTQGVNGDSYLNTTNGDVYLKSGGSWGLNGNIRGPQGIQGIQGPIGITTTNMTTAGTILGLNTADSVPQSPKQLSVVGASIVSNVFTINYQNAVSAYVAASGVDTPLTNAMSPIQMFQNLQKQNDNRFTKAESLAASNPYTINFNQGGLLGVLITTDIIFGGVGQMFLINIKGNSFANEMPIDIDIQGLATNSFTTEIKGISKGGNVESDISIIQINGKLCIWFQASFYKSFYVTAYTQRVRENLVSLIEETSTTIPTADVGGFPTVVVPIVSTIKNNGLATDLILGNGTYKPLSDFIAATQKGSANGVVPLNASTLIDQTYLPSYVDDIIEGYKSGANFYKEVGLTTLITGETAKIYVDLTTGQNSKQYRWSGSAYIQITNGLIASTNDVAEGGSNLYFTVARVLATVISGFSAAAGVVANTDTILQAINKIVGNISALQTAIDAKVADNLTASTTVAPSKTAVNTALALKADIAASTGTLVALTFTSDSVQGTIASPLTGNITGNITGAKLGVVTLVIHNHTTAPTFDSKYKKLSGSGSYVTGSINYIFCEYINDTEIIYSINQRT